MSDILYLINQIKNFIKDFNEFYEEDGMARPRIIELSEGTVSLSGFTKEASQEFSEYIKNFKKEVQDEKPKEIEKDTKELFQGNDVALSLVFNRTSNKFDVVLVNFDLGDSNSQVLESFESKSEAVSKFKIEALKHKFV